MIDDRVLAKVAEVVASHRRALVIAHSHPDGDAIGSALAVCHMLAARGYQVKAAWPGMVLPSKYRFLPGTEMVAEPLPSDSKGLVIAVDCANAGRLEGYRDIAGAADDFVNIDHHPDNGMFGTLNVVDDHAAATAEILYLHSLAMGLNLNLAAALCLYAGIVTDTGRFQFTNTSSQTLLVASQLVSMGVNPHQIYENVYQDDSLAYIRFTGWVLSRAVYDEELELIYATVTIDELREWGIAMEETEDLIDSLRSLEGHRIAALLKEIPEGGVRVSLRSRTGIDIGNVARKLGGGGHKNAAGYTSHQPDFDSVIRELKEEIIAGGWGAPGRQA